MQSIRDATPDAHSSATACPPVLSRKRVWPIVTIAGLFAISIGGYYAVAIYPRSVTRYEELQSHVGKRVTFVGVFDDSNKAYQLVTLDEHPIRFYHTLGAIDWAPHTGEECRVVGVLEFDPNNMWGSPYRLSQAEYFPISTGVSRMPEN